MLGKNLINFVFRKNGVNFNQGFNCLIGLIEPELVKIKDGSVITGTIILTSEPNSVAFRFTKLTTSHRINHQRSRPNIGATTFETFNQMNTRGSITKLISPTKLQINSVMTIEVKKIITLNQRVRKFRIRNARAAFADTILDKFTIEKLRHREVFTDFTQEIQEINIFKPIIIID